MSDYDSYISNSSDDSDFENEYFDDDLDNNKNDYNKITIINNNNCIGVDGINSKFSNLINSNIMKKSVCCNTCHNIFPRNLVIKYENEKTCYHCVFWLLYKEVWDNSLDKKQISLLKKYIELCFEEHDFYNCKRAYNGCILCELNVNLIPDSINDYKNKQKLKELIFDYKNNVKINNYKFINKNLEEKKKTSSNKLLLKI